MNEIFDIIIMFLMAQTVASGGVSFYPRKKINIIYNILCNMSLYHLFCLLPVHKAFSFSLAMTLLFVLSLTMYYIHEFRGTNVNFSDIMSINTAKEVAGGYKYNIIPVFVIWLVVIIFIYIFGIREIILSGQGFWQINSFKVNFVKNFVMLVITLVLLKVIINQKKYDYSITAGENEGYLYNFFSSIPLFYSNKKSYSSANNVDFKSIVSIKENIKSVKEALSRSDVKKPYIIVVMNESFGLAHKNLDTNVEVTPYFDSLKGMTKGNLYVNTFGGGTANTEFEFLTGMTIGNYSYPVMPYNNFVKRDKYSLAHYFKALSYKTIAMHPYTATNYHRDKVYKKFGFDELLFFNDFSDKKYVRNFVSDESFYEEVIRRFEKSKANNELSFIFGITMQNHSGYAHFEGEKVRSNLDGYGDTESLDSYLSLVKISDDALKTLVNYFEKEEEHVVILFFGDHNASFGTKFNKFIYGDDYIYSCTDTYKVPFFIYDNKKKEDKFIDSISANFLSLELIKNAGLPYDILHKFLDNIYRDFSTYSYHMRKNNADNILYDIPVDEYMNVEREYLK